MRSGAGLLIEDSLVFDQRSKVTYARAYLGGAVRSTNLTYSGLGHLVKSEASGVGIPVRHEIFNANPLGFSTRDSTWVDGADEVKEVVTKAYDGGALISETEIWVPAQGVTKPLTWEDEENHNRVSRLTDEGNVISEERLRVHWDESFARPGPAILKVA